MNKKLLTSLSVLGAIAVLMVACEKDFKNETPAPRPAAPVYSFVEEFDTVANLTAKGWVISNKSYPVGPVSWRQGMYELGGKLGSDVVGFPAYSARYTPNDFVSVDMNATSGAGVTSAWLIGPMRPMKNGDRLIFYTRTHGDYIDRMQVRLNLINGDTYVGDGNPEHIGNFTTLLEDINAGMTLTGYPINWTRKSYTFTGITGTVNGRFAFRYYVPNSGPSGSNADMIGIDSVAFVSQ
ncbi:MAG TPA: choice-of-anchor J domain-containing protein [Chitinophagaceae bacterium]|nr:choice-of-anchor J domain-containing protein [Chitinophagaceae bacterium]